MGTTSEKLTYLNDTKLLLKDSINDLGGELTSESTYRSYPYELDNIYKKLPKITDKDEVIHLTPTLKGKMTSELYGNSLQNGTPTPSTPVEVDVATGLQKIYVCDKNLFDKNNINLLNAYYEYTGDTIHSHNSNRLFYIKCKPNTTYAFTKGASSVSNHVFQVATTSVKPEIGVTVAGFEEHKTDSTFTYTTGSTARYITVRLRGGDDVSSFWGTIQIEENSTVTSYEAYNGTTFEVNLGKNLFDKSNANIINCGIDTSRIYTSTKAKTLYISIKGGETYTVTKAIGSRFYVCTTTSTPEANMTPTSIINNSSSANLTITAGVNDNFLAVYYYLTDTDTLTEQQMLDSIQIEVGQKATTYSPYFTPIELNKIGDYQDFIKKSTGKNLFNKSSFNEVRGTINTSSLIFTCQPTGLNYCFYMTCKPNTTYTVQKRNDGNTNRFAIGSSQTISLESEAVTDLTSKNVDNSATSLTITTGANDNYLIVQYYRSEETTLTKQKLLDSIQLEEGSTATSYEPYGVNWYIGKNTRRLELTIDDMNNNESYPGWKNLTQLKADHPNINTQYVHLPQFGIHYKANIGVEPSDNSYDIFGINTSSNSNGTLYLNPNFYSMTQTQWKTNYPNLIFKVIYNLKKTEYEIINNEDIISQLETLQTAKSKEGKTNINTDGEIATIISVSAIKGE